MKKIMITCALAAAMVLSLAACGSTASSTPVDSTPVVSSSTVSETVSVPEVSSTVSEVASEILDDVSEVVSGDVSEVVSGAEELLDDASASVSAAA